MSHTEPPPQPPELDSRRISGRLVVLSGLILAIVFLIATYVLRPTGPAGAEDGTGDGSGPPAAETSVE